MVVSEIDAPVPGPDEVVIKVAGCGICGTDLSLYHGSPGLIAEMKPSFPLVVGHEFAGEVVERGADVRDLQPGEWVTVNPHLYCGACPACARGQEEICANRPIISFHRPGGAAEYVAVRARNAYRLPRAVAETVGALGEPLAVAVHALERVPPDPGDRVLIIGAGPIGLLLGVACQEAGCDSLVLSGLPEDAPRLRLAEALGIATAVSGPALEEAVQGGGIDLIYEAAGSAASLASGLGLLRAGGRLSALGIPPTPVPVDLANLVLAQKAVIGTRGYTPRSWSRAVQLLTARGSDLQTLVTHRVALEDYEKAMGLLEAREGAKIFLIP
jgi:2-desacetyl-2-hydroxyethyl bacteriochlorophyllide A dehydrogenase